MMCMQWTCVELGIGFGTDIEGRRTCSMPASSAADSASRTILSLRVVGPVVLWTSLQPGITCVNREVHLVLILFEKNVKFRAGYIRVVVLLCSFLTLAV